MSSFPPGSNYPEGLRTRLILRTLEAVGWVIGGPKGAASRLGLKRTTLIHKMQKLGISRPHLESSENVPGPVPQEPDSLPQM